MAAQRGVFIGNGGADFLKLCHDPQRVAQHILPLIGHHHAAPVSIKQADTKLALQQADLPAECGLRDVQPVSGLRQAAKFGDMDQGAQLGQFHAIQYRYI